MAYKLFLILINVCTVVSMYYSVKSIIGERSIIFFSTILYAFCRYRLDNLYVRAAIGESLAMVFVPLVLVGIYHVVCGDRKRWRMLVIGASGIIQSHVLSVVLYSVLCVGIILLFGYRIIKEKRYIEIVKVICCVVLINAFFLGPFLFYYIKGNLAFDALYVDFRSETLNLSDVLGIFQTKIAEYGRDYSLRLPIVLLVGFDIWCCFGTMRNRINMFWTVLLSMGLLALFMATNLFPYYELSKYDLLYNLFKIIQFPWRFVGIACGIIILTGAVLVDAAVMKKEFKNIIMLVFTVMIVCDVANWNLQWDENGDNTINKSVNANIIECVPEYMVNGNGEVLQDYNVIGDEVNIISYVKTGLNIKFEYIAASPGEINIPIMNYQTYKVYDSKNGNMLYETGDNGNICLKLDNDGETHEVSIEYKEPILFRICELLSILAAVGMVLQKRFGSRVLLKDSICAYK